jgi:hypothetical protein
MMPASYAALTAARAALANIETTRAGLDKEHGTAVSDLADAEAALTHELGAQRLGESSASELAAARKRHDGASATIRSIVAARAVLDDRLPVAQRAVTDAEAAFRAEAAELLRPAYERQCEILRTQAAGFALAYTRLAQYATVVARVERGVITGGNLLRAAGDPLEVIRRESHVQIDLGFEREPRRFTEDEILQRIEQTLPEAAE